MFAIIHRWRRKIRTVMLVLAGVCLGFGGLIGLARLWRTYNYPYGWSHCCIKQFMTGFEQYAEVHRGHYPAGQDSPEASLSILYYQEFGFDANLLRGKTIPEDVVQAIFDQKGFLGPENCGWHYVEGLTHNDDSRLAILWDKAGLGHNGERNANGSREVLFVGGRLERIPVKDWPKFLAEQELLLEKRVQH